MEQAEELMVAGRSDSADPAIEQHRTEDENEASRYYQRGLEAEKRFDIEEAVNAYAKAHELSPDDEAITFRLAYNLDLRGEDEEAIRLYEECVDTIPTRVNALINLAVLYEDRGDFEKAARCLRSVLASHPDHRRARLFLKDVESSLSMYYDEDQERNRQQRSVILDTPVADFELSVRARNCLKKMNIHTLGDLLRTTEAELLAYKNFGETSLAEIKAMLAQKGLRLGQAAADAAAPRASQPPRRPLPLGIAPEIFNKPVAELELSVRSRKCLQRLNILTLGELAMRTEAELLGTKNFGQTSLNEIKQRLAQFGLTLRSADE